MPEVTQGVGAVSGAGLLVPLPQLTPLPSSPPCRTTPPPAQGLPWGAGFPCACAGWGSPASVRVGVWHMLCGHAHVTALVQRHVRTPAPSALLPTLPDPSDVPSSLSQGQGRGRPSSQQGPSSSRLWDSPPSRGLQAPVPSRIFFLPQFQSLAFHWLLPPPTSKLGPPLTFPNTLPSPCISTCTPFVTSPSLSNLSGHSTSALTS